MERKGSVLIYMMMLGTLVILLALALAYPVQQFTDTAMDDINCTNDSISDFNKAACVVVDLNLFYFIGALIFIGGIIITARVMFAGEE